MIKIVRRPKTSGLSIKEAWEEGAILYDTKSPTEIFYCYRDDYGRRSIRLDKPYLSNAVENFHESISVRKLPVGTTLEITDDNI